MRVMIVNVHFAPESFGGATLVAEETAIRLRRSGHEVIVVTGTGEEHLPPGQMRRYEALDLPVVAIRHAAAPDPSSQYDNPAATGRFREILDATRPDVVHFHAMQGLGVGLVEAAQEAGIPTVVTLHDAWWLCERMFMVRGNGEYCGQVAIDPDVCATCIPHPVEHRERQERSLRILNACARVLTPSAFWRDIMVASGVDAERAHVNANGVSRPAPGWRHPSHGGPVRLGFVGGVNDVKGYHQVVKALRSLRRSDYELLVVDSLMNLGGVGFTLEDWDVPGFVHIVPGYNRDSLDDFFGSIDVLLFPSQWKESYGLTVREAALRGVWPIATDGGGTVEHIEDGVNGTVIPLDGGFHHLAAAIDAVLEDPSAFVPRLRDGHGGIATLDEQAADLEQHLLAATKMASAAAER